jgi:N4-gp56 family major capsid protein
MAEIGVTEIVSQDLVSAIVQETLKEQAQFLPTVMSYPVGPGQKSVAIPRRDQFSAADKTENTALSLQEMTFASDVINLNKHKGIATSIEDIADLQSQPSVLAEVIKEMSSEIALQVDKDIITELKAVSSSAPDHLLDYADTVGDAVALADFAEARRLMRIQNLHFKDDNYYAVINPDQEKNILAIDNFISAEKYGSREALLMGEVGKIFGWKILVSNLVSATECLMYHKSHVGFAMQQAAKFESDRNLLKLSDEYALSTIYGVETLDSGKRGVFFNGSGS